MQHRLLSNSLNNHHSQALLLRTFTGEIKFRFNHKSTLQRQLNNRATTGTAFVLRRRGSPLSRRGDGALRGARLRGVMGRLRTVLLHHCQHSQAQ